MTSAIALDVGCHTARAGSCGVDQPSLVEASCVGNEGEFPLKFTTRKDKIDVFTWEKSMTNEMRLGFIHSLVVSQGATKSSTVVASFNDKTSLKFLTKALFEISDIQAFFALPTPTLAAFGCGLTSAVVADFGATHSTFSVIEDGVLSPSAARTPEDTRRRHSSKDALESFSGSYAFGGNTLDNLIIKKLEHDEKIKFPAYFAPHTHITDSYLQSSRFQVAQDLKHSIFRVAASPLAPPPERMRAAKIKIASHSSINYRLPDNTEVDIAHVYEYLPELYFNPKILERFYQPSPQAKFPGVVEALKSLPSLESLVVTGGMSQLSGFQARLLQEVGISACLNPAMCQRPYASWTGASILGSISGLKSLCITKAMYVEQGLDRIVQSLYA